VAFASIGVGDFYRDRDMKEIDLLILKNGILYPVEIKKSARPSLEVVKNSLF